MSEVSILRHLGKIEFYQVHRDKIEIEYLSKELHPILRVIDAHFTTKDEPQDLSVDDLSNLYFSTPRNKVEFYTGIFDAMRTNDASVDTTVRLIQGLRRSQLLREISLEAYDAAEGRGSLPKLLEKLGTININEDEACEDTDNDFVSSDLVEIVNTSRDMEGLGFRLGSLNRALGPLRKGEFGFLFARPETGKTSFLASEITWMAQQASQPILWLNNEEVGTQVMLRCYQATLELNLTQLMSDLEGNRKKFLDLTNDRIKLKDAASIHYKQVEKLCEKYKPSLIVFDQIDKIKGFDNDREDLRLGSIYIWARELAKFYAPVIGVCQADGSGEGQRWLTMANVANAKTSKQAEADWILGIGRVNDPGYDNLRFLHLSKNKLPGGSEADPTMRHGRWEVLLDPMTARYKDL